MILATVILVSYLGAGLLFAFAFAFRGAASIDSGAKGSGIGFRLLIIPASTLLWPMLLLRWRNAARGSSS